jgi:hypothetical protein
MILQFTRDQIIEMVKDGFLHKKSIFHYDVCMELAKKKTQSQVAEDKDVKEPRTIRYIKTHKCKYCI